MTYVPSSSSPNPPMKQSTGAFKLFSILLMDNADPIDAAATVMFGLITLLHLLKCENSKVSFIL